MGGPPEGLTIPSGQQVTETARSDLTYLVAGSNTVIGVRILGRLITVHVVADAGKRWQVNVFILLDSLQQPGWRFQQVGHVGWALKRKPQGSTRSTSAASNQEPIQECSRLAASVFDGGGMMLSVNQGVQRLFTCRMHHLLVPPHAHPCICDREETNKTNASHHVPGCHCCITPVPSMWFE